MSVLQRIAGSNLLSASVVVIVLIPIVGVPLFSLWVHSFLKDYRTLWYGIAYLLALVAILTFWSAARSSALAGTAAVGAAAGYLAGLVAYAFLALVHPAPLERVANALSAFPLQFLVVAFASPAVMGFWLYGALAAVGIEILRRYAFSRA